MVNWIEMSAGNLGALMFIKQAFDFDAYKANGAFGRMQALDISGSRLYMLWNDCCDRDTEKALNIMLNNDIQDIFEHINYENGRGIPYE